jgi:ribosome biogenesis GTPase A
LTWKCLWYHRINNKEYALQYRGLHPDVGPWKLPKAVQLQSTAPIGISEFSQQLTKRSKSKPFSFNIMVAGESGLGKTTFLNTLFNSSLTEEIQPENLSGSKTVKITPQKYGIMMFTRTC